MEKLSISTCIFLQGRNSLFLAFNELSFLGLVQIGWSTTFLFSSRGRTERPAAHHPNFGHHQKGSRSWILLDLEQEHSASLKPLSIPRVAANNQNYLKTYSIQLKSTRLPCDALQGSLFRRCVPLPY